MIKSFQQEFSGGVAALVSHLPNQLKFFRL